MKEKRNDSIELQVEIKTKDGREKVTLKFPEIVLHRIQPRSGHGFCN